MNARNFDFGTYQTSLGQYNADRNFALNRYNTDLGQFNADRNFDLSLYNTDLSQYNTDRNFDMSRYLAELDQFNNDRNFDFNLYQTDLGQFNTDRNFNYGVYSDEFNRLASQIGVLTDQDNTAYARAQAALKAAGRDSGTETKTVEPISDALASQLMNLSGTDAANALTTYYDRLTESQRNILARRAGVDPFTVKKGLDNAEDTAALLSLIAPQTQNIYDIIDAMKANGASDLEISQVIAGTSGIDQREKAALLSKYTPEYNGKSIPSAR